MTFLKLRSLASIKMRVTISRRFVWPLIRSIYVKCCRYFFSKQWLVMLPNCWLNKVGWGVTSFWKVITTLSSQTVLSVVYFISRSHATQHLRKRLFLIEKLRDARRVGIVVNPLDTCGYKEALQRVRILCNISGKKSYTLAIGKVGFDESSFAKGSDQPAFMEFSRKIAWIQC